MVAAYTQPRCCQENYRFWPGIVSKADVFVTTAVWRRRGHKGLVGSWLYWCWQPLLLVELAKLSFKSAMSSLMRRAVSGSVAICRASLRYLIIAASGPALGSWLAAALVVIFMLPFLLHRTITEDRILQVELAGYSDYAARVRWRLVPAFGERQTSLGKACCSSGRCHLRTDTREIEVLAIWVLHRLTMKPAVPRFSHLGNGNEGAIFTLCPPKEIVRPV